MTDVNSTLQRMASGPRSPFAWLATAAIVAICAGVASIPLMLAVATWVNHLALRKDWAIAGPPCPEVPAVTRAAKGHHQPPPFVYLGVRFAPEIGNSSCEAVPDEGWFPQTTHPVCQFSGPGAVTVTAGARTVVYEPGVGHRTTVTVRNGRPSCVVGGWFKV
jgi:hypothetical protein